MTAATLMAGAAGALAGASLLEGAAVLAAQRRARAGRGGRSGRWAAALAGLGRRVGAPSPPRDLDARLAAAGAPAGLTAGDLMAIKAGACLAAALAVLPLAAALPLRLAVVAVGAAAATGFAGPDVLLRRRARRRGAQVGLELPDVLDLLRVAVDAGLPVGRAISEVARRRGGLLADELARAAVRVDLGVPRREALGELRRRLPAPPVATLVAAVERADRHGTPLGPALAALAEETRAERARRLRDHAAAAAPRIQLAIALLLVPAAMLTVAAGLVHGLG
ncbi:MAG TPA: type II secretion system F family protein [Baekduia sp.]|nr:type II secretion system F family protein [Baekduia sp.]